MSEPTLADDIADLRGTVKWAHQNWSPAPSILRVCARAECAEAKLAAVRDVCEGVREFTTTTAGDWAVPECSVKASAILDIIDEGVKKVDSENPSQNGGSNELD